MDDDSELYYDNTIHGHSVSSAAEDNESRRYLKDLDTEEAKTIFNQAKVHGNAEFEVRKNGVRTNYSAGYKDGRYTVESQGKEKKSGSGFLSGWF